MSKADRNIDVMDIMDALRAAMNDLWDDMEVMDDRHLPSTVRSAMEAMRKAMEEMGQATDAMCTVDFNDAMRKAMMEEMRQAMDAMSTVDFNEAMRSAMEGMRKAMEEMRHATDAMCTVDFKHVNNAFKVKVDSVNAMSENMRVIVEVMLDMENAMNTGKIRTYGSLESVKKTMDVLRKAKTISSCTKNDVNTAMDEIKSQMKGLVNAMHSMRRAMSVTRIRVMTMNVGKETKKREKGSGSGTPEQQAQHGAEADANENVFANFVESTVPLDGKERIIHDVIKKENPDIVLFQEYFKDHSFVGQTKDTGTCIWYNRKRLKVADQCSSLDDLMKTYKYPMLDFYPSSRMCVCEMEMIDDPYKRHFVIISWHGRNNQPDHGGKKGGGRLSDEEKKAYFKPLMACLYDLYKKVEIPIVVGGDFNIRIENISQTMIYYPCFMLSKYEPSDRIKKKIPKKIEEKENGVIDYFIGTNDVKMPRNHCKYVDLKEATSVSCPEDIFGHDPIIETVVFNTYSLTRYVQKMTKS